MFADLQQVPPGDLPARFPRSEPLAVLPNDDVRRDADLALLGHVHAALKPRRPTSPCALQHAARPPMKRLHGRFSFDRMSTARRPQACATIASLPSPSHMRLTYSGTSEGQPGSRANQSNFLRCGVISAD
jgi:hypothetical protein